MDRKLLDKGGAPRQQTTDRENTTTAQGGPVADDQNSLTAGPRGPVFAQTDAKAFVQLCRKLRHWQRETA